MLEVMEENLGITILLICCSKLQEIMSKPPSGFVSSGQMDQESSIPSQGGLLFRPSKGEERHVFKVPAVSALGLDRLADQKRAEKREASYNSVTGKPYRKRRIDTPSHSGGVSDAALERFNEHRKANAKYMEGGLHLSSRTTRELVAAKRSEWDQTPSLRGSTGNSANSGWSSATPRLGAFIGESPMLNVDIDKWDEENALRLDRDWYNGEESGVNCCF